MKRKFSEEYKAEEVRLVLEQGLPPAQAARASLRTPCGSACAESGETSLADRLLRRFLACLKLPPPAGDFNTSTDSGSPGSRPAE